ncbi:Methylthioribulose-1-phosphate dehydratase [Methanosarcinaceae archaeon Ag5]|uniref:Methylthioribulose-1-phosphate dehydratase n=1 Tax=Methanolapillus africanus TaxID=3028297 RepID=A0AAE4SCJ4_9EURY|nr:Methylthioribulose-1-phosphate dehydratase [Methanosarcinaceae archaeon Ag5]
MMWQEFQAIGKRVVGSGLVESNFGNMSVRSVSSDTILITKTGAAMDELDQNSIVEVPLFPAGSKSTAEKMASSETAVHRKIYQETDAKAILHAHCPYSVVMSLLEFEAGNASIVPVDSEGKLFLGEIPIVVGGIGSDELAINAANAFAFGKETDGNAKTVSGIVVLGHGTFAIGNDLKQAYRITTQLEYAAKIKYLYATAKNLF